MMGKSKKLLSSLLALAMVLGLFAAMPRTAKAANPATINIGTLAGTDQSEQAGDDTWTYNAALKTLTLLTANGNYTLTGTNGDLKVVVDLPATNVTVTLNGVSITTNTGHAFAAPGGCTITLVGNNTLTGGNTPATDSGIKSTTGPITLTGTGTVTATGTNGIDTSALVIQDCTVTATGTNGWAIANQNITMNDSAMLTLNNGSAVVDENHSFTSSPPASTYIWKLTNNATTAGNLTDNPIAVTVATGQTGTIAREPSPNITSQPVNRSILVGGNTTFSVVATGYPAPTYEWQYTDDGGANWYPVVDGGIYSGASTNTLTLTNVPISYNGYQYNCTVDTGINDVISSTVTLTVTNAPAGGSGGGWYPPNPTTTKVPEAPKPAFPVSGTVVGKRITVYKLETLKTTLFRLNKGDAFTVLGIANNGKALLIECNGQQGYVALKDISLMFGTPIKATAQKKAAAYIKLENGKLKRAGFYPKEQTLWIHGISGKYLINTQTDRTYYLDAAQWKLWLPQ